MVENHRKSLNQKLHFLVDKSSLKMPKMKYFGDFWKHETCGQTVLPDRSILIGQFMEKAKIKKKNQMRLLGWFSTTVYIGF